MEMVSVVSSNIKAIGWKANVLLFDGATPKDVLRIEYLNGGVFDYVGVDQDVFKSFLESNSKGSFFHKNIKDKYQTIRQN